MSSEKEENFMKEFFALMEKRFEKNSHRHPDVLWQDVQDKLEINPEKILILQEMENTGGEPDVLGTVTPSGKFMFCDFSAESPNGRRSVCYDKEALASRKKYKPKTSALEMAESIGIELLTEDQYRELQKVEKVDRKTSSWVQTPSSIREKGGALFCDRRYEEVFVYHNGAESYYGTRGFRGCVYV
jgi:hypothetical protein